MHKQMKKINGFLILGFAVILLSACSGGANAEPTQDPNVVFTQVAETVMVSMTQTAEAVPTANHSTDCYAHAHLTTYRYD